MSYRDHLLADQRLAMLRFLAEAPQHKANSSVITKLLDAWGHAVSRDWTRTQLRWLEEQGLVQVDDMGDPQAPVLIATLTERGADVASGRALVPSIARPGA